MSATGAPSRRSMLGTQHSSTLRSAPSYGFGTAERPKIGGGKIFISKDMVSDKHGMNSPGPVYNPKSVDGKYYTPSAHSFGASHRYSTSSQKGSNSPNPGPGQYTMPGSMSKQPDSQKLSYSSWKFGTSTRKDQAKGMCNPCHHKTMDSHLRCCMHSPNGVRPMTFAAPAQSSYHPNMQRALQNSSTLPAQWRTHTQGPLGTNRTPGSQQRRNMCAHPTRHGH